MAYHQTMQQHNTSIRIRFTVQAVVFTAALVGAFFSAFFVYSLYANAERAREANTRFDQLEYLCSAGTCISEHAKAEFAFDYFVLEWPEAHKASVRFFEKGEWTQWAQAFGENDTPDHSQDSYPYQLFMRNGAEGFQVSVDKAAVHDVRLTYYTLPGFHAPDQDRVSMALNESPSDLRIVQRAEWIDSGIEVAPALREEKWPSEYDDIKKIIIHHTATTVRDMNNDGAIDHADYREAVRAIYHYHAKSRGWGDVGYQYIIDSDGMIWEGRFGGNGAVGGHAFREKSCKKFGAAGIGFNRGSIGISILGTYEEADITPQAKDALTSLIARKSWEFNFDPAGKGFFIDQEYPNVIGHRDVDCTNCPGQRLHAYLDAIRAQAQEKYHYYSSAQPRVEQAELIDISERSVELRKEESKEVRVRYRNTGTVSWRNYGKQALHIARVDIKRHIGVIGALRTAAADDAEREVKKEDAIQPSQFFAAHLREPNVAPGAIGTFILSISDPPEDFIEKREYVLAFGENGWLPLTTVAVEVVNGNLPLAATLVAEDGAQEGREGDAQKISVRFKNRGTETWKKGEVSLSLFPVDGESSNLKSETWDKQRGEFVFAEQEVLPGQYATFSFPIQPRRIGEITNLLFLTKEGKQIAGSDREELRVTVKPVFAAQVLSTTIPPAMLNVWRPAVMVRVKNVGEKAWDAATLASIAPGAKKSVFTDTSWGSINHIDTAVGVQPGSVVTFVFRMKAPKKEGTYREQLALNQKNRTIYFLTDNGFAKTYSYSVRVDAAKKKTE